MNDTKDLQQLRYLLEDVSKIVSRMEERACERFRREEEIRQSELNRLNNIPQEY